MRLKSSRTLSACLLASLLPIVSAQTSRDSEHSTWREYGGAADGAQYSSLTQINRTNVTQLQRVWSFPTGDTRGYAFNPLVIDRTMYVLAHP